MQRRALLLMALFGALFVARSAAGPLRAVAQPQSNPTSEYVFVKLLFDGHDQPNFDKWHANATAATVAKAAGVPVNYLIRLVDGKLPGAKEPAQKPATVPSGPVAAVPIAAQPGALPAPVPAAAPVTTTPAAPTAATPVAMTAPTAATPAPAAVATPEATSAPAAAPAVPSTPAVGSTAPSVAVNLITSSPASTQPAAPAQTAVKTNPESAASELESPQTPTVRPRRPRVFVIGGRKLAGMQLAPNQALVEYAIKTNASEPWAVRETVKRKLMSSAANFGMASGTSLKGFYTLLRENGVGYYPSMWIDGQQILSGEMAMEAPHNRFINGSTKNFQHKLYKHSDLVKNKPRAKNGTNVTVTEPAFIMANRSTSDSIKTPQAAPKKSGLAPWMVALIVLGAVAIAAAVIGTVWRCYKERKAQRHEDDAAHSEPLSPHSMASHGPM